MHDPLVVAFSIPRPWPRRSSLPAGKERWRLRRKFWTIAGRSLYWPSLITIWHVEPNGRDSGEVCKHSRRWQDEDGKWHSKRASGWKWHLRHWKIQVHPLQALRRWALTRCEWCGGRSRKGDYVNVSKQWDGERGPWWRGERGLFHGDCSSISSAHRVCTCGLEGLTDPRPGVHQCLRCDKWRRYDADTDRSPYAPANRLLATIPEGTRDPDKVAKASAMWRAYRHATEDGA